MAIFRSIQMSFWTDAKVADDFTPEDKFMYLYLMTNPHTNLCGCYEISMKQISDETGYTKATVEKLIKRLEEVHKVVLYSKDTKEVLILNWSKYNWSSSEKFRKPLLAEIQNIKNAQFKAVLTDFFNGIDTVSIPYTYGSDTTVTVTDTVTVSNTNNIYYPDDEKLDKAFSDFVEHRKKLRKPLSDKGVELAIKRLEKLSGGNSDKAVEIINQSILGGWQGLFELKDEGKSSKPNKFSQGMETHGYDFSALEEEAFGGKD